MNLKQFYSNKIMAIIPEGETVESWIDEPSLNQLESMASHPSLFNHIAVMPDVHLGKGAVVGSVYVLDGVIVPNCVGVDIGCGMCTFNTKIPAENIDKETWKKIVRQVRQYVPTGFKAHEQTTSTIEDALLNIPEGDQIDCLYKIKPGKQFKNVSDMISRQLGTLGGGNHFIEFQVETDGNICITIHSGSRKIGFSIAEYYNNLAKTMNDLWMSPRPNDLYWLPYYSDYGFNYYKDMEWAMGYARINRLFMMQQTYNALCEVIGTDGDSDYYGDGIHASHVLDIPHNFAAMENHLGKNVVVHRKGACRLRPGELTIIPGSMGTATYIVEGVESVENTLAYNSCSHGAGRKMSRRQAKTHISEQEFADAVRYTFTDPNKGYIDEAPQAYKNIENVVGAQVTAGTLRVIARLEPICTIKAMDGCEED